MVFSACGKGSQGTDRQAEKEQNNSNQVAEESLLDTKNREISDEETQSQNASQWDIKFFTTIEEEEYIDFDGNLFRSNYAIGEKTYPISFYWCEEEGELCVAEDPELQDVTEDSYCSVEQLRHQNRYVLVMVGEKQSQESYFLLCDVKNQEVTDLNQKFMEDARLFGINDLDSIYEIVFNKALSQAVVICNQGDSTFCWNLEEHTILDLREILKENPQKKVCWISDTMLGIGVLSDTIVNQTLSLYVLDTVLGTWTEGIQSEYHYRPGYTEQGIYWSSVGNALYFYKNGDIGICNLSTGERSKLDGIQIKDVVWKTDGERAIFWNYEERMVVYVNLESNQSQSYTVPEEVGKDAELHFYGESGILFAGEDYLVYSNFSHQ
jgi:hypothetical protein